MRQEVVTICSARITQEPDSTRERPVSPPPRMRSGTRVKTLINIRAGLSKEQIRYGTEGEVLSGEGSTIIVRFLLGGNEIQHSFFKEELEVVK